MEKSTGSVWWQLLFNCSQQLSHYCTLIINVGKSFLQAFTRPLSAGHLLRWFTVQVLTSLLVRDLSYLQASAEVYAQIQLPYMMNPLPEAEKVQLGENITSCSELHFLISCKTAPLATLHPFYPVCMKIGQRCIMAIGTETSQKIQSSNRFCCNSDPFLLLIRKIHATPQNQVVHMATKVSFLNHDWPWIFQMH